MIIYNDLRLLDCGKVGISRLSTSTFCILMLCLCTAFLQVFISSPAFSEEQTLSFPRLNAAKGSALWFPQSSVADESKRGVSTEHTLYLYVR